MRAKYSWTIGKDWRHCPVLARQSGRIQKPSNKKSSIGVNAELGRLLNNCHGHELLLTLRRVRRVQASSRSPGSKASRPNLNNLGCNGIKNELVAIVVEAETTLHDVISKLV